METNNQFMGMNGFYWWMGVVENRLDPLNLKRVQVRIFGHHTDNKIHIPTEDLPWAQPIIPSDANKPPVEGEWLFGFFIDGVSAQMPYYMGIIPGIPAPYIDNIQKGFVDPRTDAELQTAPKYLNNQPQRYPLYKNEPTTSRAYRNENADTTVLGTISQNLTKNIPVGGGGTWNQPDISYNAKPPYNDVKETESGHLQEFDDTPGAERINTAHKTGSYEEYRPDGSKVIKVVKDNYEVVMGDNYVYIQGNCDITASAPIKFKAPSFLFDGPISTTSTITAAGDVVGNGISLDNHTHPDPQGGNTGKPQ